LLSFDARKRCNLPSKNIKTSKDDDLGAEGCRDANSRGVFIIIIIIIIYRVPLPRGQILMVFKGPRALGTDFVVFT